MSNSTASNVQIVSAAVVRDWAIAKGLRTEVTRGRLKDSEVAAFNARHKAKQYTPGQAPVSMTAVKVGRKTVKVESATLRAAIGSGKRGKVNMSKATEYVIGAGLV